VRPHDIIKFGQRDPVVDTLRDVATETRDDSTVCPSRNARRRRRNSELEQAFISRSKATGTGPRAGEQLQALLRAGHHLGHVESEEELLHTILRDAVSTLKRSAAPSFVRWKPIARLRLRALDTGNKSSRQPHRLQPKSGAACFTQGQSIFAGSVTRIRTARRQEYCRGNPVVRVVCLAADAAQEDRRAASRSRPDGRAVSPGRHATGDALAAHVSAGIESAQLLRKQRDLFYTTVTVLAQAVEMRDEYTGNILRASPPTPA